jgi:hypothetical protein
MFARWLLNPQKSEKVASLKMIADPDARAALDKLRRISAQGREALKRPPTNQAESMFGKVLPRIQASLDPDA